MKQRRNAPSKIVAVRYHLTEIEKLHKKRKKKGLSVYIREKSLS